jgi:hypothetical protein
LSRAAGSSSFKQTKHKTRSDLPPYRLKIITIYKLVKNLGQFKTVFCQVPAWEQKTVGNKTSLEMFCVVMEMSGMLI